MEDNNNFIIRYMTPEEIAESQARLARKSRRHERRRTFISTGLLTPLRMVVRVFVALAKVVAVLSFLCSIFGIYMIWLSVQDYRAGEFDLFGLVLALFVTFLPLIFFIIAALLQIAWEALDRRTRPWLHQDLYQDETDYML